MNQPNEQEQMRYAVERDPIHRILATEEPILPTSGFLAAVMERVQEDSRAPAPIPFPWKRAVPGILLATGVFGWGAFEFVRVGIHSARNVAFTAPQLSFATQAMDEAAWVGLAVAISLASWIISRRISGQSGLL